MINVAGLSPHNQLVFAIWCIRQAVMLRGEANEYMLLACSAADKFIDGRISRNELARTWSLMWGHTQIWSGLWNMLWIILQSDSHTAAMYASESVIRFTVHLKHENCSRDIVSMCKSISDWDEKVRQIYQSQQKRIDELLLCNN